MQHFRFYFLDGNGDIMRAEDFAGLDYAKPVIEAVRQGNAAYVEIWQRVRGSGSNARGGQRVYMHKPGP